MQGNLRQTIKKLEHNPPEYLLREVLLQVAAKDAQRMKVQSAISRTALAVSLVFTAVMSGYVAQEFAQSEFLQYLSLAFSDSGVVFSSWKEFVLLLAESAPLTGVIMVVMSSFIFLFSVKLAVNNMKAPLSFV